MPFAPTTAPNRTASTDNVHFSEFPCLPFSDRRCVYDPEDASVNVRTSRQSSSGVIYAGVEESLQKPGPHTGEDLSRLYQQHRGQRTGLGLNGRSGPNSCTVRASVTSSIGNTKPGAGERRGGEDEASSSSASTASVSQRNSRVSVTGGTARKPAVPRKSVAAQKQSSVVSVNAAANAGNKLRLTNDDALASSESGSVFPEAMTQAATAKPRVSSERVTDGDPVAAAAVTTSGRVGSKGKEGMNQCVSGEWSRARMSGGSDESEASRGTSGDGSERRVGPRGVTMASRGSLRIGEKERGSVAAASASGKWATVIAATSPSGSAGTAAKLQSVVKAAVKAEFGSHAKDMQGKKHDLAELRTRRNRAIFKGMKWMSTLLTKNNFKLLYDIGDDAPNIFFEIWYTSANSSIRTQAKGIAKMLTEKLEENLLKRAEVSRDAFFEAMFMLRIKNEMELDCGPLLTHSDRIWTRLGYKDTGKLFGVTREELNSVSVEDWLMLLMRILIMDYNNILFRNRWRTSYGMKEAFVILRSLELAPPPPGLPAEQCPGDVFRAFHDSFYLATHIVFGFSAYSAIKTSNGDCPWVYTYIRKCLRYWMKMARLRDKKERRAAAAAADIEAEDAAKPALDDEDIDVDSDPAIVIEPQEEGQSGGTGGEGGGGGPADGYSAAAAAAAATAARQAKMEGIGGGSDHVYVDIDGVGEIVDCLRGLGLTEASDPMVCQGTVWLLDQQAKNGSWPSIFTGGKKGTGVYDKLHPTWVCTQALRDRDFQIRRNQPWQNFIDKLVKDTNISSLLYKPKW